MHLSGVILKIASLEVGLEKFHTHKRVGLGLVIVVINTPKATKSRFNPTQHDEWHVGQRQHRNFPKQQNPTMSPFNSARTKNHQTTDHSVLTNLTHRDASMHAYAHHRDLNILSSQSVHKKICSIYFLHPMDIIHHTKHRWFGKPRTFKHEHKHPLLDQSPGQARHPGPGSLAILGGLDASNKVFRIESTIDSKNSSLFFWVGKNSTASPQPGRYRLPEHIVLRTPSSSDQVSLSWARWRSCTFMSFTWTVVCNKQFNSKYQFQHNWTYVCLIVFVAIAPEFTKTNQDAS